MTLYVFKLGQKEKLILKILALEPKQHQQSIKEKLESLLNKPVNYGSVVNMVKALHRKKLIENEQGKSRSGKTINLWKLSEQGLKFMLEYGDLTEEEKKKVMINFCPTQEKKRLMELMFDELGYEVVMEIVKQLENGRLDLLKLVDLLDKPEMKSKALNFFKKAINESDELKKTLALVYELYNLLNIAEKIQEHKNSKTQQIDSIGLRE